ncbi:spermatogenesis-associated protein 24-like [Ruditapes philippinarum]|uniref:spermatogenesis-associated protein 24-like n=1 Tax=Ruditapes philippinarum TaxID=129788 RepID=UPI00295AC637|nr:spermatogenesis-associated protein 24-like [Ruditapes philippinarum]
MADSDDNSTEYEQIPSHIIVQKQLQDLIAIQKARVARLEQDVSMNNETLRDSYIPKEQYETELSSLQESLRSDYVPREHYEMAVKQLEEEKMEHAQTKLKLNEVVDKLEEAMAEINNLREQVQQQKVTHEKTKGALKSKHMQETAKSMKLQSKCSEFSRTCEMQEEILNSKNSEIKDLERKLQEQQSLYKKEITEAEIEKKQQRYIAKMMEEQERKNSRTSHQAVPKTKSFKR